MPEDLQLLAKALGMQGQDQDRQKGSAPSVTPAPAQSGRRSVLDNMKCGPGNRPYWEMKEGQAQSRYPDLLRTLSKGQDPSRRLLLFESHMRKMGGIIGAPGRRIEQQGTGLSHIR